MLQDDRVLRQSLGARGAHVVRAERRQHRRAHLAHQDRGEAGAEHDRRHHHVPQVLDRILGERHVAARRKPVQVDREEADHHQAEPEVRHAQAHERRRRRNVVRRLALPDRGDDAGRDPDHDPDEDRQKRELDRRRQPVDDRLRHRQLALVASEVSLQREPEPLDVLDGQRLVEAVVVADRRHRRPGRGSPRRARSPGRPGSARPPRKTRMLARRRTTRAAPSLRSRKPPIASVPYFVPDFLKPANCARIRPSP